MRLILGRALLPSLIVIVLAVGLPVSARQTAPQSSGQRAAIARPCRVLGQIVSGQQPLPGASVTILAGEKVVALTSSNEDGSYAASVAPGTYRIRIELTAFLTIERDVTTGESPCDALENVSLVLASRAPALATGQPAAVATPAAASQTQGQEQGRGQGRGGRQAGPPRFQTLSVTQSEAATSAANETVLDVTPTGRADDPAARLLPAGFSLDAPFESVTVAGTMVELDRNLMNDRMAALGRGEFGLAEGQFGQPGQQGLLGGLGGFGAPGDAQGGRGAGPGGPGGRGGPGGPGLGGRVGGGNRLQINANYAVGGSMFDSAPYQLRDQVQPQRDYLQQTFSTTVGGPVRIPRLYNGTGRTTFNFTYSGNRDGNLFDQYATVPGLEFRAGDFSSAPVPIIDPLTGQPFAGNRIPDGRLSQAALALLRFIPEPTLSGTTRNFRNTGTSRSTADSYSLRITHSITAPPAGRGGRGGRGAAGAAGATGGAGAPGTPGAAGQPPSPAGTAQPASAGQGGRGAAAQGGGRGRGGRGAPVLNVSMNAAINYRRNDGDRLNVFPLLTGATRGSTLSAPVTVNVRYGRSMHNFNLNFSRTKSTTLNDLAFNENIVGAAGIGGVSTDPFDWGVPSLSFGSYTGLRDVTPSRRNDRSFQFGYSWTRPAGSHNFRIGGSYAQQWNDSQSDSNARGSFTFSGLYTASGFGTVRGSGQDFADFLLGLPQQATRSYSISPDTHVNPIEIRGKNFSLFFQDDWRWKARWTINYGVQYDFLAPFVEANGHMVNLDANADFTAVAPVLSGETGAFSGAYPTGLVTSDWNNLAPRVGAAWRATNRSVVRFGYGLSFSSGTYSSIARQLYQQPPFFLTGTSLGSLTSPLTLANPFANVTPATVTNTYGIDKDYELGLIHQWTADYSRDLFRTWAVGATYVGTRGSRLDLLRAPNRGPTGLRIAGVEAFTWQSSEGSSYANGLSLRLQKRQARGVSGNVSYTLSKSRDNTTATGGGATVAQDDQNLAAEWALSSFDRRHQVSGSVNVELPWGANRRWLSRGGWLAALIGNWAMSANVTWQSGTPLTARCSTCASDVARGTGGTLRADYTGLPISLARPTIDEYFNTEAFGIPAPGTFGNSLRNVIIGPGSKQLNANFTRDVRLGGNRNVSIQVNASNLLNLVNYAGVDTNVNSPTFGQIASVRGMRTVRLNLRFRF